MRLIIFGAGGFGRCARDIAEDTGRYDEIKFLDDGAIGGDVIDTCANFVLYLGDDTEFFVGIGNNEVRAKWLNSVLSVGGALATIIHPRAFVSKTAKVYPGSIVFPSACIGNECVIKPGCIINFGVIVDHGNTISRYVHLAPGAIVKAENVIPEFTKVDSGVVIEARSCRAV